MKQNFFPFRRAMLLVAVLLTSMVGVAASAPGLLTETDLPQTSVPYIYAAEGIGKYTVSTNGVVGSEVYCRINSGEWFHYKKPIVFTEYGSYRFEAYAVSLDHSPSNIVSKDIVVNSSTGANLVDTDTTDPSMFYYDGFKYKINGTSVALTRQNDAMCSGDLVIPSHITHNGVTYMVTAIEDYALYNTHNITSVSIPYTVNSVGYNSLSWSSRVRSIDVDPDNPNYCDIDGVLFDKSKTTLLFYANMHSSHYTIPDGVKVIDFSAFEAAFDLVSVTFPSSVTTLRTSSFACCSSLASVTLPSNLSSMGPGVFHSCTDLKSVTFSPNYSKIPEWTFESCSSLETVVIPGTINTIAYGAFRECYNLSTVTLCEGVRSIQEKAFATCRSLRSITLPSSVSTVQAGAFEFCNKMTDIYVDPANNYYCDVDGVLYNKGKTALVTYPVAHPGASYAIEPTTRSIGDGAFQSCKILTHVMIPAGLTTVGSKAFDYCNNISDITCLATTPPSAVTNAFSNYNTTTLRVPFASIEAYRAATPWSQFYQIVGAAVGGDVDGNGVVGMDDLAVIINMLLSSDAPAYADVNGDGAMNMDDLSELINTLLHQ